MTLKEICLIYNGTGWGTFMRNPERKGRNIGGNPPKEWYRIYQVEETMSREAMRILSTKAVHLEDQKIVPSKINYDRIFLDLSELATNT